MGKTARETHSQTIIRRELMLKAIQTKEKNYTFSTFPSSNQRNFKDTGKVLVVSVSEFYKSIAVQLYQHILIRCPSLLYVCKETTVSVMPESLSISVRFEGDFVTCFCQPSGNVFESEMTSFQRLLTPVIDLQLSVNMILIGLIIRLRY